MGAQPMTWITRYVLAISVAILPSFFALSNSVAQQCTFSGNCIMPLTCQPGLFGGYCAVQACNADTDCRTGSICDFGVCQNTCTRNTDCDRGQICIRGDENRKICVPRPIAGGGGGIGPPPHYYTEGGICGTIRLGGALSGPVKHLGCAPGLQCVGAFATGTGTCQRPPS